MKPTDPEFKKMVDMLFQTPEVLETAEEKYQQAVRRVKRLLTWLALGFGFGYCILVSGTVLIVLGWLKLLGVI